MMETDVITLDESDDELTSSGGSSPNIYQPSLSLPTNVTKISSNSNSNAHATCSIVNEKPLDLSFILKDTSAPKPLTDMKSSEQIIKNGNTSFLNFSVLRSQNQQKIVSFFYKKIIFNF